MIHVLVPFDLGLDHPFFSQVFEPFLQTLITRDIHPLLVVQINNALHGPECPPGKTWPVLSVPLSFRQYASIPKSKHYRAIGFPFGIPVGKAVCAEAAWAGAPSQAGQQDLIDGAEAAVGFWLQLLESQPISMVLRWGATSSVSVLLREICEATGLPFLTLERGIFDKSLLVSHDGQWATSDLATVPALWMALNRDLHSNGEITSDCRYVFAKDDAEDSREVERFEEWRAQQSGKVALFLGDFDLGAGLRPPGWFSSYCQSPVFDSSERAATFLRETASQCRFSLIIKSHPATMVNLPGSAVSACFQCQQGLSILRLARASDFAFANATTVQYALGELGLPVISLGGGLAHGCPGPFSPKTREELTRIIDDVLRDPQIVSPLTQRQQRLSTHLGRAYHVYRRSEQDDRFDFGDLASFVEFQSTSWNSFFNESPASGNGSQSTGLLNSEKPDIAFPHRLFHIRQVYLPHRELSSRASDLLQSVEELVQIRKEMASLTNETACLRNELDRARDQLQLMKNSIFWRMRELVISVPGAKRLADYLRRGQ